MQKRWIVRGLIVVGGFASLGTEQAPSWGVTEQQPLTAAIDATTPTVKYAVHVELHGGPFANLDGYVAARLDISPKQAISTPSIAISSITHPDETISTMSVPAGYSHQDVFLDAWLACEADPCVEDYQVTITGDSMTAPIQITGYVEAHAGGAPNEQEPPGTSITMTLPGPL